MRYISSSDSLTPGTVVFVGSRRGTVTKAKVVEACNGGKIVLHTVHLTEQFKRGFGKNGRWEKLIKPLTVQPSYASIKTE